ncbi:reverse transcriptase domain-containing protein [Tanacetum coccineum]
MEEEDEDKTTFFAGEGVYCYRKMPFGLKNAGATYQRLVDKVFNDQIVRNLVAYVDDMVIKSTSEEDMLADIKETFQRKHKYYFIREKGKRTSSYLLCKQSPTGSRAQLPCIGKTHTSVGTRSKKVAKIFSGIYGAGLMLIVPKGKEYTYALRFKFLTTNNETKYEALLAGLRIAQEMEIVNLAIFVDSQLLVNQVKGIYAAKQPAIREYLQRTKETLRRFRSYTIEHIRRNQNKKDDALSKLASMTFKHLTKEVLVEVLAKRSIEEKEVLQVETKENERWMTPIHEYLLSGLLPEDPKESRKIIIKAPQYKLIKDYYSEDQYVVSIKEDTAYLCLQSPKTTEE